MKEERMSIKGEMNRKATQGFGEFCICDIVVGHADNGVNV